jgi:hypothetical protein
VSVHDVEILVITYDVVGAVGEYACCCPAAAACPGLYLGYNVRGTQRITQVQVCKHKLYMHHTVIRPADRQLQQ